MTWRLSDLWASPKKCEDHSFGDAAKENQEASERLTDVLETVARDVVSNLRTRKALDDKPHE